MQNIQTLFWLWTNFSWKGWKVSWKTECNYDTFGGPDCTYVLQWDFGENWKISDKLKLAPLYV